MTTAPATRLPDRVSAQVAVLTPSYFALVMATGIVAVGLRLEGFPLLGRALWLIAVAAYAVLLVLTSWRLASHRPAIVADFFDPTRAFGFFTFVAGTNVLATYLTLSAHHTIATVLLGVTGAFWLVLGYLVPWTAVLDRQVRPVVRLANGSWFLWVVASQSVAVVAASLEPVHHGVRRELAFLAVMSWSVGIFLYAATAVLVTLRLMLYDFRPEELDPPYWVSMGALSITVLAGARIVAMTDAPTVHVVRELVGGLSFVCWAFATWLIPVLVAAGWWRHVRHGLPLAYTPTLWSMVFPLGMYAVAGIHLGRSEELPLVEAVGTVELWVAVVVWAVVFGGLLRRTAGVLTGRW